MYHIIVNPASKSGRGQKIWNEIEPILKEKQVPYEVRFTKKQGDAAQFAEEFTKTTSDENCRIIILGGDGTLNETIQNIQNLSQVTFGYIPTGSSNDFARDTGISTSPKEALEHILSEKNSAVFDIGEITYHSYDCASLKAEKEFMSTKRRFLVSCGIGFDAAVCEEAMCSKLKDTFNKLKLGKLTYVGIALKQLLCSKRTGCTYYIDDEAGVRLDHFIFIAAMIHKFEGGGFMFAPMADAADGQLDICIGGDISKPKILYILPHAFKGNHVRYKGVQVQKAQTLRIISDRPLWVHTDGEVLVKATDISVNCNKYRAAFYI